MLAQPEIWGLNVQNDTCDNPKHPLGACAWHVQKKNNNPARNNIFLINQKKWCTFDPDHSILGPYNVTKGTSFIMKNHPSENFHLTTSVQHRPTSGGEQIRSASSPCRIPTQRLTTSWVGGKSRGSTKMRSTLIMELILPTQTFSGTRRKCWNHSVHDWRNELAAMMMGVRTHSCGQTVRSGAGNGRRSRLCDDRGNRAGRVANWISEKKGDH